MKIFEVNKGRKKATQLSTSQREIFKHFGFFVGLKIKESAFKEVLWRLIYFAQIQHDQLTAVLQCKQLGTIKLKEFKRSFTALKSPESWLEAYINPPSTKLIRLFKF